MDLAVVQAAGEDGPGCGLPGGVGRDRGRRAVVMYDLELGQPRLVGAVDVAGAAVEPQPPAVPAVAEPGADGVGTLGQVAGDVVGAVPQAPPVNRPSRAESIVADAHAVDL